MLNEKGQGGDARHFFVLAYIFFIACYLLLSALAAPIISTGQQNSVSYNVSQSNFTWNASSSTYSTAPDIFDLLGDTIAFHTNLWLLDAILIGPGAIYLFYIIITVVVRGT